MDDGLHDAVLHATSSLSKQADRKSSNGKMRGVITVLATCGYPFSTEERNSA